MIPLKVPAHTSIPYDTNKAKCHFKPRKTNLSTCKSYQDLALVLNNKLFKVFASVAYKTCTKSKQ